MDEGFYEVRKVNWRCEGDEEARSCWPDADHRSDGRTGRVVGMANTRGTKRKKIYTGGRRRRWRRRAYAEHRLVVRGGV